MTITPGPEPPTAGAKYPEPLVPFEGKFTRCPAEAGALSALPEVASEFMPGQ
jgi:hypothetical protein